MRYYLCSLPEIPGLYGAADVQICAPIGSTIAEAESSSLTLLCSHLLCEHQLADIGLLFGLLCSQPDIRESEPVHIDTEASVARKVSGNRIPALVDAHPDRA